MKRRAFTLIELLVVIAIIAILAAILFPVFAKAREKARQSSCVSNLKQLSMAIIQYNQDFDEVMPWLRAGGWGTFNPPTDCANGMENGTDPYVKNHQVWVCPSDSISRSTAASAANDCNGDGMGEPWLSYTGPWHGPAWTDSEQWGIYGNQRASTNPANSHSRSLAGIPAPAETLMLYELWMDLQRRESYTYYRWYNYQISTYPTYPSVIAYGTDGRMAMGAHLELGTYAFCDGHVKSMRNKALLSPKNLISWDPND